MSKRILCYILGILISTYTFAQADWVVVMSKSKSQNIIEQAYSVNGGNETWPTDWIKKHQSKGFIIDHISFRKNAYFIVLTKFKSYAPRQSVMISQAYPKQWINDRKNDGYRIANILIGFYKRANHYVIVMNKETKPWYMTRTSGAPEHEFENYDKWQINKIQHCWDIASNNWFYVLTKGEVLPRKWGSRTYMPTEFVEDNAQIGFFIKSLSLRFMQRKFVFWDFVLEKNPDWIDQVYYVKAKSGGPGGPPHEWIKKHLEKEYFITYIF